MSTDYVNFVQIDKIGNLKYDELLFSSYYPILFVCKNDKNELFLVVCCTHNGKETRHLITKTTPTDIIDLLNDKITIRDCFLLNKEYQFSLVHSNDTIEVFEHLELDWGENSTNLPDKGEFIEAEENEFIDVIAKYKNML